MRSSWEVKKEEVAELECEVGMARRLFTEMFMKTFEPEESVSLIMAAGAGIVAMREKHREAGFPIDKSEDLEQLVQHTISSMVKILLTFPDEGRTHALEMLAQIGLKFKFVEEKVEEKKEEVSV